MSHIKGFFLIIVAFFLAITEIRAQSGGGDLQFNDLQELDFSSNSVLVGNENCGPCYSDQGNITETVITSGVSTLKMPGVRWVGSQSYGDSCEVEINYKIYLCREAMGGAPLHPTLVVESILIKSCCNPGACVPTAWPGILIPNEFPLPEAWTSALIRQIIDSNTGGIVSLADYYLDRFSLITKTCYLIRTINPNGNSNLGAFVLPCNMECCSSNFLVQKDLQFPCAYRVTGARAVNTSQCFNSPNQHSCTPQCTREAIEDFRSGVFVKIN